MTTDKVKKAYGCQTFTAQVAVHAGTSDDDVSAVMNDLVSSPRTPIIAWQYADTPDNPVKETRLEAALAACLRALQDAATVVDPGDGESYAYQHEIEAAEAALADFRQGALTSNASNPGRPRHTPGEWAVAADEQNAHLHPFHQSRFVVSRKGRAETIICRMMDSHLIANDARLIAAAPQLRALLDLAYRYLAVMAALPRHRGALESAFHSLLVIGAAKDTQTTGRPKTVRPDALVARIEALLAQIDGEQP